MTSSHPPGMQSSHQSIFPYFHRDQTPAMRRANTKKHWLSDPSTYPLQFCLAFAGFFCTGVGINCLMYNPDVQINPVKRNKMMRDWTM